MCTCANIYIGGQCKVLESTIPKQAAFMPPGQMPECRHIQMGVYIMHSRGWMIQPWAAAKVLPSLAPASIRNGSFSNTLTSGAWGSPGRRSVRLLKHVQKCSEMIIIVAEHLTLVSKGVSWKTVTFKLKLHVGRCRWWWLLKHGRRGFGMSYWVDGFWDWQGLLFLRNLCFQGYIQAADAKTIVKSCWVIGSQFLLLLNDVFSLQIQLESSLCSPLVLSQVECFLCQSPVHLLPQHLLNDNHSDFLSVSWEPQVFPTSGPLHSLFLRLGILSTLSSNLTPSFQLSLSWHVVESFCANSNWGKIHHNAVKACVIN